MASYCHLFWCSWAGGHRNGSAGRRAAGPLTDTLNRLAAKRGWKVHRTSRVSRSSPPPPPSHHT